MVKFISNIIREYQDILREKPYIPETSFQRDAMGFSDDANELFLTLFSDHAIGLQFGRVFQSCEIISASVETILLPNQHSRMYDKEAVKLHENLQSLAPRMPKVLVQLAEVFPTLKKHMVSVLCMIGIVLSCSLLIAVGAFDIVVPRQN